jgi:transposase
MGQPIEITRTELSVSGLRALAGKSDDGAVVCRLLAIALVLEGRCRTSLNSTTRQTLRDWVHRCNAERVDGLRSRTGPGRPPFVTDAQMEELREMVLKGPDPERNIVVRWRCADLCEEVAGRWSVRLATSPAVSRLRLLAAAMKRPWIPVFWSPRRMVRASACQVSASPWNPSDRQRCR